MRYFSNGLTRQHWKAKWERCFQEDYSWSDEKDAYVSSYDTDEVIGKTIGDCYDDWIWNNYRGNSTGQHLKDIKEFICEGE